MTELPTKNMDIIEILKQDYQRFPAAPTYSIYDENVYFRDPMTQFRGLKRYQQMIDFMATWFKQIQLDLHDINQEDNTIKTKWTLSWTTPLPWQPRIHISGWSELLLNADGKIESHIDYWDISRLEVLQQHLKTGSRSPKPPKTS